MTDKEKIKAEIERRARILSGTHAGRISDTLQVLEKLLSFIGSMQEEHKLKPKFQEGNKIVYVGERKELDTDEHTILYVYDDMYVTTWGKKIPFKFQDDYQLVEEPASKDLEDFIYEHLWKGRMGEEITKPIYFGYDELLAVAQSIANWQKRQMMKDAIVVEVKDGTPDKPYQSPVIEIQKMMRMKDVCNVGDKVKLIIIKED